MSYLSPNGASESAAVQTGNVRQALFEISQTLQQPGSEDAVGQQVIAILEEQLGYQYCALMICYPGQDMLIPLALSPQGQTESFVSADRRYLRESGICKKLGITGWVATHGEAIRSGDVTQDPRYFGVRSRIRSELCVPIAYNGQILGVLNTETPTVDAYSADDEQLLQTVANLLAVSLWLNQVQSQVDELEGAQAWLAKLNDSMIVSCSFCHRIHLEESDEWVTVDRWLTKSLNARITHGTCSECYQTSFSKR
jgi:GAF domain-containing protein